MITKRDIVDRAFKLLSMNGFYLDDSPEDSHDILQTLDDLMAELQGGDYDFGYRLPTDTTSSYLDDPAGIAMDALSGISHKLAVRICSVFGKNPPPLLIGQTAQAYNALLTRYQKVPNLKTNPITKDTQDNWLFGAGNNTRWWR